MTPSNIVNSIGLAFDIAGVVLVFRYGLPESISREGESYLLVGTKDPAEMAKAARYDRWAKIGLSLLLLGFALQLASNFI
jgi:hypothetical protein